MPIERLHFWGISAVWLFYVLAGIAIAVFLAGVYLRVAVWMAGRGRGVTPRACAGRQARQVITVERVMAGRGPVGQARVGWWSAGRSAVGRAAATLRRSMTRAGRLGLDALLGRRILRGDVVGGLMHLFIMWGFLGLFVGTVLSTVDHWFVHFLTGRTYQVFSLCLEIVGLMLIVGLLIALVRRYLLRVPRLENKAEDLWILLLLAAAVVTGFVVEGTRLAVNMPDWESYSFAGVVFSHLLSSDAWAQTIYPYLWWFHALICLGLVAYFPFSKLFHSLGAPVNIFAAPRPVSILPVDEGGSGNAASEDGACGVAVLGDRAALGGPQFTLRDLLELSICTRCGRCDEVCPSASATEPFSPQSFIAQANAYTRALHNPLSRVRWFREGLFRSLSTVPEISPEQIWYCTTCRACLEVCPVYIGAHEPIKEVRRAEIEDGSRVSPAVMNALEMLYRFDNPWEPSKKKRKEWARTLTVPDLTEGVTAGLCYWVGCTTSYDTRAQSLARAFVRILTQAGVEFGTLGQKEVCCGDIARRLGEEGLFEEQVSKTLDLFATYGIVDLVTSSPHCFNVMKNEYPPHPGAPFRVRHYAQVLDELLVQGALRPHVSLDLTVTFHDPCYLGRYNHIYEAPRRVIRSLPGVKLVEMAHSGADSLCCGGGGGRMWQELEGEMKLSEVRIREAAASGAEVVVTACPYCLIMLEDAVKTANLDFYLKVIDLNELVAQTLGIGEDET